MMLIILIVSNQLKLNMKMFLKIFKIYPVCPYCGEDYSEPPATSKKDNKTKICPRCGVSEAFIAFMDSQNPKNNYFGEKIITFLETQKKTT